MKTEVVYLYASVTQSGNIFQSVKDIPIMEVAPSYVSNLKPKGNNLVGPCPFHSEKTPSFFVFAIKNSFRCFGCGEHGDSVDLVCKIFNLRPADAARLICRDFGIQVNSQDINPAAIRKAREVAHDREIETAFRQWCDRTYEALCIPYRAIHKVLLKPENIERIADLYTTEAVIEYYLDILLRGTDKEKLQLFLSREAERWTSRQT